VAEKFSVNKFFDFSPQAWYKIFGLGLKILVLTLIIMGILWIRNILFPTPNVNTNNPNFIVESGGTVEYHVQQGDKKREWWLPTPGVGIRCGQRTNEDKPYAEVFGEVKWEF